MARPRTSSTSTPRATFLRPKELIASNSSPHRAAHVTGKPLTSAEACTWLDEHFLGTLAAAKSWVDRYFLGGVNHICYHGTCFSPDSEPWPGRLFYASVELQPTNSYWPHFHALNEYVARCQSFLQGGRPDNDLLVYYPIHDEWSAGKGPNMPHFNGEMRGSATRRTVQALAGGGLRRRSHLGSSIGRREGR
ncbi:MAG: glycosyl hydrolase [Luteolibacter sp.]